jgi:hypothetical protein
LPTRSSSRRRKAELAGLDELGTLAKQNKTASLVDNNPSVLEGASALAGMAHRRGQDYDDQSSVGGGSVLTSILIEAKIPYGDGAGNAKLVSGAGAAKDDDGDEEDEEDGKISADQDIELILNDDEDTEDENSMTGPQPTTHAGSDDEDAGANDEDPPLDNHSNEDDPNSHDATSVVGVEAIIVGKKKRVQNKRLVGTKAASIKQMKDSIVKAQALIAARKVATVQEMTQYVTDTQASNNPSSQTYLLNFDMIVQRPDLAKEGERARAVPKWTLLLPDDVDHKTFGIELEKLAKALQEGGKKKGSRKKRDFLITVVYRAKDYLESIYGKKKQKKKEEEKEEES